jgi:hypothetical protein
MIRAYRTRRCLHGRKREELARREGTVPCVRLVHERNRVDNAVRIRQEPAATSSAMPDIRICRSLPRLTFRDISDFIRRNPAVLRLLVLLLGLKGLDVERSNRIRQNLTNTVFQRLRELMGLHKC